MVIVCFVEQRLEKVKIFMQEETVKKTVLINVEENEIRAACLENQQLVDLFIERTDDLSLVGNLYRGVVEDVVPGLQAAFVDIGFERRAFLHFDDFCPESLDLAYKKKSAKKTEKPEDEEPKQPRKKEKSQLLQKGVSLLVQVLKDEIGTKGPRITTYISLPGRYLVYLPYPSQHGGVSRKIEDEKERQRLRKILGEIKDANQSFIVRTAGMGMDDEAIKGDIGHLKNTWSNILRKFREKGGARLLFNDHDILYRIARDNISDDVQEVIINEKRAHRDFLRIVKNMIPSLYRRVHLFNQPVSLFQQYDVEKQIQRACHRKVWLKSGGYVVFDETEALTAVDVNSGRFINKKDQEKIALKTNQEACKVIAQQLRLRDIGGIIVIDFIDMDHKENRQAVEDEFARQTKSDRAKMTTLPISEFGLLQLTRKRVRQSLGHQVFDKCPYCGGSGRVLTPRQLWREMKYSILNLLQRKPQPLEITVVMHTRTKNYVQDKFMGALQDMEKQYKVPITILSSEDLHVEDFQVRYMLPDRTEKGEGRMSNGE